MSRSVKAHSVVVLALVCGSGPGMRLTAQAPSAWTELAVSSKVRTSGIMQRGKVLAYRDGNTLHAWSGLTRSWRRLPISSRATVTHANDLVLVVDGDNFTGFSSYAGRFATITLKPGAVVLNSSSNRNDSIVLVRDGVDLWAISGFVGTWVRRKIGSTAKVVVRRHVAVVADGKLLSGMSAFRGRWQSVRVSEAPTMVAADGTVGIAMGSQQVHGFSALRESWTTSALQLSAPQMSIAQDLIVLRDAIGSLAFSGLRGSFSRIVTGIPMSVVVGSQVAVARAQKRLWFYSAHTGNWLPFVAATTPVLFVQDSLVLVLDGSRTHGFSGPRGTVSTVSITPMASGASRVVAVVRDGSGKGALFSALSGAWDPLPGDATANLPTLASTGALVPTTTGFAAYSARRGTYHPIAAGSGARVHADPSSAILAVEDGNRLRFFEPRRRVWMEVAIQGPLRVHLWRTSFVAVDGQVAIGFGAFHGRIHRTTVVGAVAEVRSNSESGRIVAGNRIYAFSAVPLLSSPWQFPEFRRAFVAGAALDLHLSAAASTGTAFLALGVAQPFPLPGLGEVLLDPALVLPVTLSMDARAGTARASIFVPDFAAVRGLELYTQALVFPATGSPYVTDLATVMVY